MTNLSGTNLNNRNAVGPKGEGGGSPSKFPRYPEYAESGVKWFRYVPKHWEAIPLKWHLQKNDGGVWGQDPNGENDTGVLRSTDQTVDGHWRISDPALRALTPKERVSAFLKTGDLVVTKSSGSSLHIGKTTLVSPEIEQSGYCYGNFMQRLRPMPSLLPKFTWYLMNNDICRTQLDLLSNSTTGLANLNGGLLGELMIPLAPLKEQIQVVRFLDHETAKIDALIAEQQRLTELLKEKRQAVISHAVTKGLDPDVPMKDSGVEWLGEVPAHWTLSQFKFHTSDMQTGPFGSQIHADDYVEGGVPLINPAHLVSGEIVPDSRVSVDDATAKRLARHSLKAGNLIFARRGELGRCAVVNEDQEGCLCGTGSLKTVLDTSLQPNYAYLLMTSQGVATEMSLASKGSTMENLNTETLGNIRVPVPPIDEQHSIIEYVDRVLGVFESLISEAEKGNSLMAERRSALISAAVTGKIDVRAWQPDGQAGKLGYTESPEEVAAYE